MSVVFHDEPCCNPVHETAEIMNGLGSDKAMKMIVHDA